MKKNICKFKEDQDYIIYKALCSCGCTNATQFIEVEVDKYKEVSLTISSTLLASAYFTPFWKRMLIAIKVLLGSSITVEESVIMDEESLNHYVEALTDATIKLKNYEPEK